MDINVLNWEHAVHTHLGSHAEIIMKTEFGWDIVIGIKVHADLLKLVMNCHKV